MRTPQVRSHGTRWTTFASAALSHIRQSRSDARHSPWAQFWSTHSPLSGTVHRWPRGSRPGRSRTVANPGGRRSAVFGKRVGGNPLASSSLASSATLTRHDAASWQPDCPCLGDCCLSLWPRNGGICGCGRAGADVGRTYCSWSRTPRTRLHAGAHAAEACWCQTPELRHERSACSQNVTVEDATGAPDPPLGGVS